MPVHTEIRHSPYTQEQLFALVADVESYPEFLPWCVAARILEREENGFLGELAIRFAALSERYTSRVTLSPPHRIEAVMEKGPFAHLVNRWEFKPAAGGGTEIHFFLDFQFRSKLLEKLIGGLFTKASAKMAEAFARRADQLYGA